MVSLSKLLKIRKGNFENFFVIETCSPKIFVSIQIVSLYNYKTSL